MIFLTEEDVRQRCELGQGGEFRLQAGERLTPAATELLRSRNCRVILPGQCTVEAAPVEEAKPAAPAAEAAPAAPAAEQASFLSLIHILLRIGTRSDPIAFLFTSQMMQKRTN